MKIRKMTVSDYEEVYGLWLSCKGMGLNNLDDSREGIARFLARNPETCFVAAEEERIVGSILVGNDGRRAFVYHTAVHPDFRRRGIAAALVDEAVTALKTMGINKAAMVVFAGNEAGNAFWDEQGFTARPDLCYRNKALTEMKVIVT
jgi:ribosomal protein S18 acetylase RimI-like enzyme